MLDYIWPIALVVASNVVYQVCAKGVPNAMDPFASLTVTYLVAAVACLAMFFLAGSGEGLAREYSKLSWAPFVFGIVIVGLEVGWIFAYRAGWEVSTANVVQSGILAAALVALGFFAYHEALTWTKLLGVAVCIAGISLISLG